MSLTIRTFSVAKCMLCETGLCTILADRKRMHMVTCIPQGHVLIMIAVFTTKFTAAQTALHRKIR
jgi:hypothetical protein